MTLFVFHLSETPEHAEVKRAGAEKNSAVAVFKIGDLPDLGRQLDLQIARERLTLAERASIIAGVEDGQHIIATSDEDEAMVANMRLKAAELAAQNRQRHRPPDRWSRHADLIESITVVGEVLGNCGAAVLQYSYRGARRAFIMWRRPMKEIVLPTVRSLWGKPILPRPWDGE